ncbi:MAG: hypothetical protein RSE62_22900, partial [Citrobacter sp.]
SHAPYRSIRTIDIEKSIYKNNYPSCDLPGYPCLCFAEKPLITVGYLTLACCVYFPKVAKVWNEEMCTVQ